MRRAVHRCREIDLGTKPARQRTAVEKIWAATGVKGNHGEGGGSLKVRIQELSGLTGAERSRALHSLSSA